MLCHLTWRTLHRTPGVAEQPVGVVDRLAEVSSIARMWAAQEHRERSGERLDVVRYVAKRGPYGWGSVRFAAEPWPGCFLEVL
jgi:hypothetical protein